MTRSQFSQEVGCFVMGCEEDAGGLGLRKGTQWSSAYAVEMRGEFPRAGS